MITVIRSAQVLPGKLGEAAAWGKESVAIGKRLTGRDFAFCTAFGGPVNGVAWIGQYEIRQIEDALAKIMADREWATAFAKAAPIFVPAAATIKCGGTYSLTPGSEHLMRRCALKLVRLGDTGRTRREGRVGDVRPGPHAKRYT